jgi:rRNA maturation endonuclease Nob1
MRLKRSKEKVLQAVTRCDGCGKMTDAYRDYCEYCGDSI